MTEGMLKMMGVFAEIPCIRSEKPCTEVLLGACEDSPVGLEVMLGLRRGEVECSRKSSPPGMRKNDKLKKSKRWPRFRRHLLHELLWHSDRFQ